MDTVLEGTPATGEGLTNGWWKDTSTWVTLTGVPLPLQSMTPVHRANTIRFLHRTADIVAVRREWLTEIARADVDVDPALLRLLEHGSEYEVLEATPLMKRFRELEADAQR